MTRWPTSLSRSKMPECRCRPERRMAESWVLLLAVAVAATVWLAILGENATPPIPWFFMVFFCGIVMVAPAAFFTVLQYGAAAITRDRCSQHRQR